MPETMDITPFSKRYDSVCSRAEKRASRSEAPDLFMNKFYGGLSELRREGMAAVVDKAPDWLDPTHLAAEIEALAALRAIRYWGTAKGLCLTRRKRGEGLAA
jgi:hypothetical protein